MCLVLLLLVSPARADYLVVSRAATLKAEPAGGAEVVARLAAGTSLVLLVDEQSNGYYYAAEPSELLPVSGWVYRTFVRRYPGEAPPAAAAGSVAGTPAGEPADAARHLALGRPVVLYERAHEGYVLAQDGRLKTPLWVQYELRPVDLNGFADREDDFRPDLSVPAPFRAELADYARSGYDRGHMAPAADMKRSERVMSESFLLSNMCPQDPILNRGLWARLEEAVRGWVWQRGALTVISGPVFEPGAGRVSYPVIGGDAVAVPTGFYKIVVDAKQPGQAQALAFLIPNRVPGVTDLAAYLVSVDRIETLTGIDFLSALPDGQEAALEAGVASALW